MPLRRLVVIGHRWLGLLASVILAVVGGTGVVLLWPAEGVLKRAAGRLHETLALGRIGAAVVIGATLVAILLQLSGLYLWWRRKTFRVRTGNGWYAALHDLHHAAGVAGLLFMLTLAATAFAMATMTPGTARRVVASIHTAGAFPMPVRLLYVLGGAAFLIQGVTGIAMWWNPAKRR